MKYRVFVVLLETLQVSAIEAYHYIANVFCQSKQNFRSYSIFGEELFLGHFVYFEMLIHIQF